MANRTMTARSAPAARRAEPCDAMPGECELPVTDGSLVDRAGDLNATLAACAELLDAVASKVGLLSPKERGSPPCDGTLINAVGAANYRASELHTRLRDLASVVGA